MNWRRFIKRAQTDAELQRELESYVEITTEEYIAQGMGEAAVLSASGPADLRTAHRAGSRRVGERLGRLAAMVALKAE